MARTIADSNLIRDIRIRYKRGQLSKSQVILLEGIKGWSWEATRRHRVKKVGDYVPIAERLAKENGGILYSSKWLRSNGYDSLRVLMGKHPSLFCHIPREREIKTIDENVALADSLVMDGMLPPYKELVAMGHESLTLAMYNHPDKFSHLNQRKLTVTRTNDEWKEIYKEAIKCSGSPSPSYSWMKNNGYSHLYSKLLNTPLLFSEFRKKTK